MLAPETKGVLAAETLGKWSFPGGPSTFTSV